MSTIDEVIRQRAEQMVRMEDLAIRRAAAKVQPGPLPKIHGLESDLQSTQEERIARTERQLARHIVDMAERAFDAEHIDGEGS